MEVRAEHDPAAVREAHTAAFGDDGHVADLADALRSDPAALSLIATEDGDVTGHVMFSRCLLDAPRRGLADARTLLGVPAGGEGVNSAP